MKRLIVGLLLLSVVGVASADNHWRSCGILHEKWKVYGGDKRTFKEGLYMGFIMGVMESNEDLKAPINIPENMRYEYAFKIVGKWLEAHPEFWHEEQAWCVYWALREAYGLR